MDTIIALLGALDFIKPSMFIYVPFVVAIIVAAITWLLSRRVLTGLLIGSAMFVLSSVTLFFYILLQPLRPEGSRWLEGVPQVEAPQAESLAPVDGSNPVTNAVAGLVNPLIDGMNASLSGLNLAARQAAQVESMRRNFTHTIELSAPYLVYALYGLGVFVCILVLYGFMRMRSGKDRDNKTAYMFGAWDMNLRPEDAYEYDPKFNYVKHGYAKYHEKCEQRELRRQQQLEEQEA